MQQMRGMVSDDEYHRRHIQPTQNTELRVYCSSVNCVFESVCTAQKRSTDDLHLQGAELSIRLFHA